MRVIASDPGERPGVRKKVVTTTFTYDNNGNVTQKTVDGTTTTYVYDYANRLTALGAGGATTTYAYDAPGCDGRTADGKRECHRHPEDALYTSRSSGLDECRH